MSCWAVGAAHLWGESAISAITRASTTRATTLRNIFSACSEYLPDLEMKVRKDFTIMEQAPTRAFPWLKGYYDKHSKVDVKLGCRRKDHNRRVIWLAQILKTAGYKKLLSLLWNKKLISIWKVHSESCQPNIQHFSEYT